MNYMDQLISALRKVSEEDLRRRLNLVHMDGVRALARYFNLPTCTTSYRNRITGEWYPAMSISRRNLIDPIIKCLLRGNVIHKDLRALAEGLSNDGFL